jgi:hypothetical protein
MTRFIETGLRDERRYAKNPAIHRRRSRIAAEIRITGVLKLGEGGRDELAVKSSTVSSVCREPGTSWRGAIKRYPRRGIV